mmetsp:Transcript_93051/g.199567  ORF Transcript_93051/g.199567 Transcript_93051/m.199567 type:complete len:272 (-) Transcript_93051:420-1235(-)
MVTSNVMCEIDGDPAPTMENANEPCQRGRLIVAIEACRDCDTNCCHKIAATVAEGQGAHEAVDHSGHAAVPWHTSASPRRIMQVLLLENVPRRPPVVRMLSMKAFDFSEPLQEGAVLGDYAHTDVVQFLHIGQEECCAVQSCVKSRGVSAPGRAGNPGTPLGPLHGLRHHAWVESAPDLVDKLGIDRPPIPVSIHGSSGGGQDTLVHELPCHLVGKPQCIIVSDLDVHVALPSFSDLTVGDIEANPRLLNSVQRDKLDVCVVICVGALDLV